MFTFEVYSFNCGLIVKRSIDAPPRWRVGVDPDPAPPVRHNHVTSGGEWRPGELSRSRRRGVRARWQHHAAGARSLEGIDVVVHRVADGDGNCLLAVGHVQRDVAGRLNIGVELASWWGLWRSARCCCRPLPGRADACAWTARPQGRTCRGLGGGDDIVVAVLDVQLHEPLQRLQKTKPNEILN